MTWKLQQRKKIFLVIFVLLLGIVLFMVRNYIGPLLLGVLLAYYSYPLYIKMMKYTRYPIIAQMGIALLLLIIFTAAVAILLLPLFSQTQQLYDVSTRFIEQWQQGTICENNSYFCRILDSFFMALGGIDLQTMLSTLTRRTTQFFFQNLQNFLTSFVSFLVALLVMGFSFFYFLQRGSEIKQRSMELMPLSSTDKKKIYHRLKDSLDAIMKGNISTSFLQGILGGFIFWILGLPLPVFWGFVMAILAFIPALGTPMVWVPAVVILAISGEYVKALILALFSFVVLGYVDNILKPKLIGDKIHISSFGIFLGILGGLELFGILGLFFGPVIVALLVVCVEIYREMAS